MSMRVFAIALNTWIISLADRYFKSDHPLKPLLHVRNSKKLIRVAIVCHNCFLPVKDKEITRFGKNPRQMAARSKCLPVPIRRF